MDYALNLYRFDMMNNNVFVLCICLVCTTMFSACIGDDFVDDMREPEIKITTLVDTIAINTEFMFEAMFLNNIGAEEEITASWTSSDESVATISNDGLLMAVNFGQTVITVRFDDGNVSVSDSIVIVVGMTTVMSNTSISGTINTTSSYKLTGSFTLSEQEDGSGLLLNFDSDYCASTALPGLYVYLSNNRNTVSNAFEIGAVTVFSGAHSYDIEGVGIQDYSFVVYFCKPFNVKVGDGEL